MVIIDVVEGTALEALPFMTNILENRPKIFKSQDAAIQWSVQSNNLRRVESAKVSIPPQLKETIINGDEHRFEWKVDLMSTEKYWQGTLESDSRMVPRTISMLLASESTQDHHHCRKGKVG